MEEFLLTIAIPTYNRANFLRRNLEYLLMQQKDFGGKVEIFISNNSSTDNTDDVVYDFQRKGLVIRYIKNELNKGADFNIARCYIDAKGKYVLTMGDDDFLVDKAIANILPLLENDFGVIFLNNDKTENHKLFGNQQLNYIEYSTSLAFIKKVNFFVTFISGNIVNRKHINVKNIMIYENTNLIQISFILNTIILFSKNIYVKDILLYVEPDNTGGYDLFKIFGKNFYDIIGELISATPDETKTIRKIIGNSLLVKFFPFFILKFKLSPKTKFVGTDSDIYLKPIYRRYINYWICCYPLTVLPGGVAKGYNYLIRIYSKIRSLILNY